MARKNIQLVIGIRYQQSRSTGKVYSSVYTLVPNADPENGHIMREAFVAEEKAEEIRQAWESGGGCGYYDIKEGGNSFQGKVEASVVSMTFENEAVDWEGEMTGSYDPHRRLMAARKKHEAERRKGAAKS